MSMKTTEDVAAEMKRIFPPKPLTLREMINRARAYAGLPTLPPADTSRDWEQSVINIAVYGTPDPPPGMVARAETMYGDEV